ncbi:MAG: hypothetical protein AABX76_00130 [Nanoarchaeota archaeon]
MTGRGLDMSGQKLETFLARRRAIILMQDEIRNEIFRNLSSGTLEFDATGYENPVQSKELMIEKLIHLGYTIEHVDEDTLEGKPVYHLHVRRNQHA